MQASPISTASYAKFIAKALVRMTDEEIKHQELFRRLETLMAADIDGTHVMQPRFQKALFPTMSPGQVERVKGALAPLLTAAPAEPSRIVEPA